MNTSEFLTERADLESAQEVCKTIENEEIRNRSVANVFAANIASKFFDKDLYNVDTESGLHNIPFVLNNIDISDIYINNSYIDVRLTFENDNLVIPLSNFKNDLLPIAYMFIKISTDLNSCEVLGFVLPEDINKENIFENNIVINENLLKSFYDIEPYLVENSDYIEISDSEIFSYLDSNSNNIELLKKLLKSKDARNKLAKAVKAKSMFNFISISKDEMSDESIQFDMNSNQDLEDDTLTTLENSDSVMDFDSDLNLDSDSSDMDFLDAEQDQMELEEFEEMSIEPSLDDSISEIDDNSLILTETVEPLESKDELSTSELDYMDSEILEDNETPEIMMEEDNFTSNMEINNDTEFQENSLFDENLNLENNIEEDSAIDNSELNNITTEPETPDILAESNDDNKNETESLSSEFEFKTNTTPNVELDTDESNDTYAELLEEDEKESSIQSNIEQNKNSTIDEEQAHNKEDQLDSLFETSEINNEEINNAPEMEIGSDNETFINNNKKKNSKIIPLLGIVTLIGALGYLGYSKFFVPQELEETPQESTIAKTIEPQKKVVEEAMPIESIDAKVNTNKENEGNAIEIPAIEQNLDASILVSNLKVDWEVPSGYITNNSAKRYLVKLGKIIQLNLKTELLLLNKPPITNKIAVEIKFNKDSKKFEAVGITISSGEQSVDDLILRTVRSALALNLSLNSDSFSKLQGNPILVIHL